MICFQSLLSGIKVVVYFVFTPNVFPVNKNKNVYSYQKPIAKARFYHG